MCVYTHTHTHTHAHTHTHTHTHTTASAFSTATTWAQFDDTLASSARVLDFADEAHDDAFV